MNDRNALQETKEKSTKEEADMGERALDEADRMVKESKLRLTDEQVSGTLRDC